MSEIRPRITYSPEGILTITTGLKDGRTDDALAQDRQLQLEQLADPAGVSLTESDGVVVASIDVEERFGTSFTVDGDPDIAQFLGNLRGVLSHHPSDTVDRVFGLEHLDERGANGVVYQQFQRWLNTGEFTEDIGKKAVIALAQPFGAEAVAAASKDFSFLSTGSNAAAEAGSSRVVLRKAPFRLYALQETEDEQTEQVGSVEWNEVDLHTVGSCACWGATADERQFVNIDGDSKRLYDMQPHNVDFARQALSHILGISTLAFYAAQYAGTEDIFSNASWGELKSYPKAF